MIAEEVEAASLVRRREHLEEEPAEQARQHAHGQEECWPASDPARAIVGQAATRHDHVTCGWWVMAEPQLCRTAVKPILAPRCLGSAAIVSTVSAAALNKRL